jgi:single-strand DNA-binding protein
MGQRNINRVTLTGNLTADPELRFTPAGTPVCRLRVGSTTRRKDATSGEWMDKPNYFDVIAWGTQAQDAERFLAKGSPIAIDGRLQWRQWQAKDGSNQQAVEIVAESIQYLGSLTAIPGLAAAADTEPHAPNEPQAPNELQATQTAQEAPAAA